MENPNEAEFNNQPEWQAPPPPEKIIAEEPARMSEAATLGSIFFEPGTTFEDLRRKPRFILAMLIIIVISTGYFFLFNNKMGEDRMRRTVIEQIEKSPQAASLSPEAKQQQINISVTIMKYITYALPLFIIIGFAIGGLIYWIAGRAMGGTGGFLHGLSAWVYSSFPPTLVFMIANIIVLLLKSADDIDIATSQRGVLQANLGFLIDGKANPVLATLLSTFDFFQIWGWILAAIGLEKLMKISRGAAWAVVLIMALLGIAYRVISALMSGNPM